MLREKGTLAINLGKNINLLFLSPKEKRSLRYRVDLTTSGLAIFLVVPSS